MGFFEDVLRRFLKDCDDWVGVKDRVLENREDDGWLQSDEGGSSAGLAIGERRVAVAAAATILEQVN